MQSYFLAVASISLLIVHKPMLLLDSVNDGCLITRHTSKEFADWKSNSRILGGKKQ